MAIRPTGEPVFKVIYHSDWNPLDRLDSFPMQPQPRGLRVFTVAFTGGMELTSLRLWGWRCTHKGMWCLWMGDSPLTRPNKETGLWIKPNNHEDDHPAMILNKTLQPTHSGNKELSLRKINNPMNLTDESQTIYFPFKSKITHSCSTKDKHKPTQLSWNHFITRVKSRMAKRDIPSNQNP